MVLMVMALIFVLVSIILMITITNVFMKDAAEKNTMNFYDAESSMDEIRAGLAEVCGKAYEHARDEAKMYNMATRDFDIAYKKSYADYLYLSLADTNISAIPITVSGYSETDATSGKYKISRFFSPGTDPRLLNATANDFDSEYNGLANCLKGTAIASIAETDSEGNQIGGEVLNIDMYEPDAIGDNDLQEFPSKGEVVLKNVRVQYTDANNYVTKITTDIRLSAPPANISENAELNNILYYTLITNDALDVKNSTSATASTFEGNIFSGYNTSVFNNYKVNLKAGGDVAAGQICYFIGGGNMELAGSAMDFQNAQMWVKGIKLDGDDAVDSFSHAVPGASTFTFEPAASATPDDASTRLYMQDDLNLGKGASVTLKGQLFGFGNPEDLLSSSITASPTGTSTQHGSLAASDRYNENLPSQIMDPSDPTKKLTIRKDIENRPYEYSSAILVNGKNASLDLTGLSTMSLAGNAYVDANNANGTYSNKDIKTGESISIKPSQRAYLFPAGNLIIANPVPGSSYVEAANLIRQDYYTNRTADNKYYQGIHMGESLPLKKDASGNYVLGADGNPLIDVNNIQVEPSDFITGTLSDGSSAVDFTFTDADGYPDWAGKYIAEGYSKTFKELGVDGIRIAAYQPVAGSGSPVMYFFMHFHDDKSANSFFKEYYKNYQNLQNLSDRLSLYTSGSVGLQLPDGVDTLTNASNFYFNGNMVATNKTSITVPESFTQITNNSSEAAANAVKNQKIENSGTLYDTYYAMTTCLQTRYDMVSVDQKSRTLFENIVNEIQLQRAFSGVGVGPYTGSGAAPDKYEKKRYYVSSTGKGAILCYDPSNAEIKIDQRDLDYIRQLYVDAYSGDSDDASISLIISDNPISLSGFSEYSGLILSKGKISITGSIDIKQDAAAVIVAMNSNHPDGNDGNGYPSDTDMPRKVFWDTSAYAIGGIASNGSSDDAIVSTTLPSLVSYENWDRN